MHIKLRDLQFLGIEFNLYFWLAIFGLILSHIKNRSVHIVNDLNDLIACFLFAVAYWLAHVGLIGFLFEGRVYVHVGHQLFELFVIYFRVLIFNLFYIEFVRIAFWVIWASEGRCQCCFVNRSILLWLLFGERLLLSDQMRRQAYIENGQ